MTNPTDDPAPRDDPLAQPRTDTQPDPFRVGHGWDLHRLEPAAPHGPGRPLVLGGVTLDHDRGPVSHSDGDALLHAVTDAVLGALAEPDIGELFPDNAPENESRDSADFLREALRRAHAAGYRLVNLDATVVLQRPKFSPVKQRVRQRLAELLGVETHRVNVKAKTHEKVDAVGENRAVEAHASVLLTKA